MAAPPVAPADPPAGTPAPDPPAAPDTPATGFVDSVSTTRVTGWCADADTGDDVTDVHVYVDSVAGGPIASQSCTGARADSVDGHGFDIPVSLPPGERVTVYAIGRDASGAATAANPALPSSGVPLTIP